MILVRFGAERGNYTHAQYLDGLPPIAGGREIWASPRRLGHPRLRVCSDTLVDELDYGPVRVATATMGYKHQTLDAEAVRTSLAATPTFLLKSIPHMDGSALICELVRYHLDEVRVQGAWTDSVALALFTHALAPVADCEIGRRRSIWPPPFRRWVRKNRTPNKT